MSTSPEYDTIDLPAGQTIVITQPLEITHSVKIVGNGATLYFQQGSTAAWPSSASGAIYVSDPGGTSIQVELDNFTIKFDMSQPIRWSNPSGTSPSLWDPENNLGISHAVIDTRDSNSNENRDVLTLERDVGRTARRRSTARVSRVSRRNHAVGRHAPRVRRRAGDRPGPGQRPGQRDDHRRHLPGRPDRGLRRPVDHHRTTRCSGSTAETYSPAAFELHSPFDALIQGNQVTQSDPAGREFRLVVLADAGYDNTIEGNTFGGGAGQVGDEMSYDTGLGPVHRHQRPRGDPGREQLQRAVRGAAGGGLGGRPAAGAHRTSASAPPPGDRAGHGGLDPRRVNADGSAEHDARRHWYRWRSRPASPASTIELLMQDSLPAPRRAATTSSRSPAAS